MTGRAASGPCSSATPADFTPVCTTELGRTASLKGEFDKRNVKAIAVSVDPLADHKGWAPDIAEVGGTSRSTSRSSPTRTARSPRLYDMIHPGEGDTSTVRSVFIIDPKNKVRLTLTYPEVGRPQLRRDPPRHRRAAAHRRRPGLHPGRLDSRASRVIVAPTMSTEDAKAKFGDVEEVKPYLRWTPQPKV